MAHSTASGKIVAPQAPPGPANERASLLASATFELELKLELELERPGRSLQGGFIKLAPNRTLSNV